jgi:hypothetical protein
VISAKGVAKVVTVIKIILLKLKKSSHVHALLFICLFVITCHHKFRPFKCVRFQDHSSKHPVTYDGWSSKWPPSCCVVFQGLLWEPVAFNSVGIFSFSYRGSILRSSKMSSFLFWPAIRCNGFIFAAGVHFYLAASHSNTIKWETKKFICTIIFLYLCNYLFFHIGSTTLFQLDLYRLCNVVWH